MKAQLDINLQSALKQLENAERVYNESAGNLEGGANSQIINAESALRSAEVGLRTAQRNYGNAMKDAQEDSDAQVRMAALNLEAAETRYRELLHDYENNLDIRITSAESNLASAELDLNSKEKVYENARLLFEEGFLPEDDVRKAEEAYIFARNRGKFFRHKEGLRQKPLHLSGAAYDELIVFGKFVHAQYGNNIL